MKVLGTITSKRQLTIPADIFDKIGLSKGDKVLIKERKGELIIKPARLLVEELAGSVDIPEKLKGKDLDEAIKESKEKYFKDRV